MYFGQRYMHKLMLKEIEYLDL